MTEQHASLSETQFSMLKVLVRGKQPTAVLPVPDEFTDPDKRELYTETNKEVDELIALGFLRDVSGNLVQPAEGHKFRMVIVTNEAVQLVLETEFAKPV